MIVFFILGCMGNGRVNCSDHTLQGGVDYAQNLSFSLHGDEETPNARNVRVGFEEMGTLFMGFRASGSIDPYSGYNTGSPFGVYYSETAVPGSSAWVVEESESLPENDEIGLRMVDLETTEAQGFDFDLDATQFDSAIWLTFITGPSDRTAVELRLTPRYCATANRYQDGEIDPPTWDIGWIW